LSLRVGKRLARRFEPVVELGYLMLDSFLGAF
jgi:hypothetical protein